MQLNLRIKYGRQRQPFGFLSLVLSPFLHQLWICYCSLLIKNEWIHNSILCLAFHFRLSRTIQIWNANITGLGIRKSQALALSGKYWTIKTLQNKQNFHVLQPITFKEEISELEKLQLIQEICFEWMKAPKKMQKKWIMSSLKLPLERSSLANVIVKMLNFDVKFHQNKVKFNEKQYIFLLLSRSKKHPSISWAGSKWLNECK